MNNLWDRFIPCKMKLINYVLLHLLWWNSWIIHAFYRIHEYIGTHYRVVMVIFFAIPTPHLWNGNFSFKNKITQFWPLFTEPFVENYSKI